MASCSFDPTDLHEATFKSDAHEVQQAAAPVNYPDPGDGDTAVVRLLLAAMVDANLATPDGCSLLLRKVADYREEHGHPDGANAKESAKAVVTQMLAAGAGPNATSFCDKLLLHGAAANGHTASALQQLIAAGAAVDAADGIGYTALHYAAELHYAAFKVAGHPALATALLDQGASPNVADMRGNTPLHLAAGKFDSVVILLIKAGAETSRSNAAGRTAMQLAAAPLTGHYPSVKQLAAPALNGTGVVSPKDLAVALGAAVDYCDHTFVQQLLTAGALVNHSRRDGKTGWTALHRAVRRRDAAITAVLLAAGAAVNAATGTGTTALHEAADYGTTELVQLLIAAGADVSAADSQGHTPLHYAAASSDYRAVGGSAGSKVQMLLNAGAAVNAADLEGLTALEHALAATEHNSDVVEALLQACDAPAVLLQRLAGLATEKEDYRTLGVIVKVLRRKDAGAAEAVVEAVHDDTEWKSGWLAAKSEVEAVIQQQRAALAAQEQEISRVKTSVQQLVVGLAVMLKQLQQHEGK